jgi:hypothetical protein
MLPFLDQKQIGKQRTIDLQTTNVS